MGSNFDAARQSGINPFRTTVITMMISGGLSGVAGAIQCLAIYNRWLMGFSPGYGWDGITVATLGGLSPYGTIVTGMLFGMLRSASISMNVTTKIPIDVIDILQGLVVIFVAAPTLWTALQNLTNDFIKLLPGSGGKCQNVEKEEVKNGSDT